MSLSIQVDQKDKENPKLEVKGTYSGSVGRTFGTDITNAVQPPNIDEHDASNPQRLGYLAKEIFKYLHSIETRYLPEPNYMALQPHINYKMRGILVDWLVEVHLKFKLQPETLYLSVNLLDRYLSAATVERSKLQLLGVGALMVACKYEEIYAPEIHDLVYITDKAYTPEELLLIEKTILKVLDYNVTTPSAFRFLERYTRLQESSEYGFQLARYMVELALVEYGMLKYIPSLLAASAVYLGNKLMGVGCAWPKVLMENTPYKGKDLKACARELCMLLQNAPKGSLQSVRKKFMQPNFKQVASIKPSY